MRYSSARPLKRLGQRLAVEHHQVEPAGGDLVRRSAGERARLAAGSTQRGVHAGRVVHLHQKLPPPAFHQLGFRGAERDDRWCAGMDRHADEAVAIEHALDRLHRLRCILLVAGCVQAPLSAAGSGAPRIVGGGNEAAHLGEQGLEVDMADERQVRPAQLQPGRRAQQLGQRERAGGQSGALEEDSAVVHRAHSLSRIDSTGAAILQ